MLVIGPRGADIGVASLPPEAHAAKGHLAAYGRHRGQSPRLKLQGLAMKLTPVRLGVSVRDEVLDQLLGDRSGLAVAHDPLLDHRDGHDFGGRPRREALVGDVEVVSNQ